jgi:hypothetical protein
MTLRFIDFKTSEPQNPPETDKFRRVDSLSAIVACGHYGEVGLLSLFLNWQNTLFDVGRSMFDVRCSFFS